MKKFILCESISKAMKLNKKVLFLGFYVSAVEYTDENADKVPDDVKHYTGASKATEIKFLEPKTRKLMNSFEKVLRLVIDFSQVS